MKKVLLIGVLCLFSFLSFSQKLSMSFDLTGNNSIVKNGDVCSLGNYGDAAGIISKYFVIKNEDSDNVLKVTDFKIENKDSKVFIWKNEESFDVSAALFHLNSVYCNNNSINTHSNKISFKTNDPDNPFVEISFIINPDKGKLNIKSRDYEMTDNTINLGEMPINTYKGFVFQLQNTGKGYLKVNPISEINTANKITYSFLEKPQLFSPSANVYNSSITFTALKKGLINASFVYPTERG